MFDICTIAHVTRDVNTTPAGVIEMTGGAGYYFSMALKQLDVNYLLVTKLRTEDQPLLEEISGLPIKLCPSVSTHFFENIYEDYSDNRRQKVHSLAEPFGVTDVEEVSTRYFHLGPLASEDIPLELIRSISGQAVVSLDAQGFLRVIENEQVHPCEWYAKHEGLPFIDILKVNDFEASLLTKHEDMSKAAVALARYGIGEVVITMGSRSSLIYSGGVFHSIPAYPPQKTVDATGCGDTYMAGYLYQRVKGKTIEESGKFGAAMATLKMQGFGPFRGTENDILQLIASQH